MKFFVFLLALLSTASHATSAGTSAYPVLKVANPFSGSRLYVPNDGLEKHSSVVMLHGSEGGSAFLIDSEANILATQGFNVLVLCYFDCNRGLTGPRGALINVEATVVLDAVAWMRAQKFSTDVVSVYGFSRGAELTMIAGSLPSNAKNRPSALIAHSPSDTFNGPVSWDWFEPACWLCRKGQGLCPPGSPNTDFDWNLRCGDKDPTLLDLSVSAWLVNGKPMVTGDRIEIEKFSGPILLTVGEKDQMWPVAQTRHIEATLRNAGSRVQVHYFPNGGHVLEGDEELARREYVLEFLRTL